MAADAVVLINAFEVPPGEDEAFLDGWEQARAVLREQPGYVATRLHRSLSPSADFRFVNVALWQSAEAFRRATSTTAFQAASLPYTSHPSLYEVVRTDEA
jgi:heme oxygenase (mycobilin-producing)